MIIDSEQALTLIESNLSQFITEETYEVDTRPAIKFLKGLRFDLAFKLLYLDMLDKNISFSSNAYKEHIRAFSLGQYNEPGNVNKNNIGSFFEEFNNIYEDIKSNGFDKGKTLIPISAEGNIVNGAHRIVSAIKAEKTVGCINLNSPCPEYDYKYFYERNVPVEMLDAAALKFVEYASNIYIACIWPTAQGGDDEIEKVIPNIVYRKDIELNHNGAHNFISQLYMGEAWLGNVANDFRGAKGKLIECFKHQGPVRVIAFQADCLDDVLRIKEEIRRVFNVGKHSIHITDTHEEALNTARLVFNENSVHFLNYAMPNTFKGFHEKLAEVKVFLKSNDMHSDDFVLDGGMVLAAYGLRNASDIDYFLDDKVSSVKNEDQFESHDDELVFHNKSKNELIYDPNNYFYFQGVRFLSLQQIYLMKKNRGQLKDKNDCEMMDGLLNSAFFKKRIAQLKQRFYYSSIIFRAKFIVLLKDLGLYKPLRKIYRFVKRLK